MQVVRVERRDDQPPLPFPLLALGSEDVARRIRAPVEGVVHLLDDLLLVAPAPESPGAIAQDRVDRLRVADPDHGSGAELDPEDRAVLSPPPLDGQVSARHRQQPVGAA
jgi:hypothetical protein